MESFVYYVCQIFTNYLDWRHFNAKKFFLNLDYNLKWTLMCIVHVKLGPILRPGGISMQKSFTNGSNYHNNAAMQQVTKKVFLNKLKRQRRKIISDSLNFLKLCFAFCKN